MELKHVLWEKEQEAYRSFNRTFMELKHFSNFDTIPNTHCFNRTFMELKHRHFFLRAKRVRVLIGPSWN